MRIFTDFCFLIFLITIGSWQYGLAQETSSSLKGKTICIDPGHGGTAATDSYRVGPAGEREEWINLRVGLELKQLLQNSGAHVVMTRKKDVRVPLSERARMAVEYQADVFISIHHNATADSTVNFPIVYFHGNASENRAGVKLGQFLIESISEKMYRGPTPASLTSDHVIFPEAGTAVLRGTYGIPAVLVEASFFTNPTEEQRLKDSTYNRREAQAYLEALESFFATDIPPIHKTDSKVQVKPFRVFQEAERMNPAARQWKSNFIEGHRLYQKGDSLSLQKAMDFFTTSARSFPDSWLARTVHRFRAKIYEAWEKKKEQQQTETSVAEYYVPLPQNDVFLNKLIKLNSVPE